MPKIGLGRRRGTVCEEAYSVDPDGTRFRPLREPNPIFLGCGGGNPTNQGGCGVCTVVIAQ